jgi:predicted esterase
MTTAVQIETPTHGRVLIEEAADGTPSHLLVAFHGYGENAEDVLEQARTIPGISSWRIAAVQALHRFYRRDHRKVIANWMTRQDRDAAIADNVEYVNRAVSRLEADGDVTRLVFLGFSQGASMAYRAALLGGHRADGIIALCGDIPPELKIGDGRACPPVLIGAGVDDEWYTRAKLEADVEWLASRGATRQVVRFAGRHEWTDEFRATAGAWLAALRAVA